MPDDVKIVHDENDEQRVPARRSEVLKLVFLLNVDILAATPTDSNVGVNADLYWRVRPGLGLKPSECPQAIYGVECLSPPQTTLRCSTLCEFVIT